MQMIVDKFIGSESPRRVPRAFVVYELNLNSFMVHGIGVHDPSSKNTVRIIAGAVEHQSIANPGSRVVLMDVSTEPQFWLYFFDPLSDRTAASLTYVVENVTGPQGRRVGYHNRVAICVELVQLIRQLVVIDLPVGVERSEQAILKRRQYKGLLFRDSLKHFCVIPPLA